MKKVPRDSECTNESTLGRRALLKRGLAGTASLLLDWRSTGKLLMPFKILKRMVREHPIIMSSMCIVTRDGLVTTAFE
jgi:hypothetical protein